MRLLLLFFAAFLCASTVHAHKPSDSYLTLDVDVDANAIGGQWDIALRDLDYAIGLDADGDGAITWGEVRARHTDIAAYAMARLRLSADGQPCVANVAEHLVDDHTDGAYAVLRFRAECPAIQDALQVHYALFFDIDPQHKGLLRLQHQGVSDTGIFSAEQPAKQFSLSSPNRLVQFIEYVREGVWHIWIGFDHILFLLALLLPAVGIRRQNQWQAVAAFKPALWDVLKIVTAFTVAHSITLSLATLGFINLPSRWVESTIAASVVIAALNNIFPFFPERRWFIAFLFGLIHGFGFATVLADLGLPSSAMALALVGFNVGVEVGQLAIVVVFLPLAFSLRHSWFYRRIVLIGGSIAIAVLAMIWLAERAFDMQLLTF